MSVKLLLVPLFCFYCGTQLYSQDSSCIRVQFLYGSKPNNKYKDTGKKWFGGILGGHVGIEGDTGRFYSFEIIGKIRSSMVKLITALINLPPKKSSGV